MDKYTLRMKVRNLDSVGGVIDAAFGQNKPCIFCHTGLIKKGHLRGWHRKSRQAVRAQRTQMFNLAVSDGLHILIAKPKVKHYYWSNQWTNKRVLHQRLTGPGKTTRRQKQ
ncbi:hypothetical protein [Collimonas humicola]|uniref:hypothetical protein n=1 Tax=Collimonas humicola TaxID=2825886 RepID=UPI001B8CE070|nr:hypothetical protein [Collimonas humicola]